MSSVITGLLTDADLRGVAQAEQALTSEAEIAAPWSSAE